MLATQDFRLYPEWSTAIASDCARAAFHYLVGIAASSTRFVCHAEWKGEVRDFRFVEISSGGQPYSFITNRDWLLFYFRLPARRSGRHSRDSIARLFDSFHENTAGEWTIRLESVADIERLSTIIIW